MFLSAADGSAHVLVEQPSHTKITYLLSILSADEASKAVAKRETISSSLLLSDKAPWDTMKAQLLAEISKALSPQLLDFEDYNIMFFIPRVLPKPGMALFDRRQLSGPPPTCRQPHQQDSYSQSHDCREEEAGR